MTSNNYNPYNYPYQQSSAQQYSAYQTAPASNNASQSSRQYQPEATQSADYISYQAQSYGGQNNAYGGNQDSSWRAGNGYGGNQETTSRAAEVLRNMSNTSYTPNNTTATSPPGFTATNAASTSRYSGNTPHTQQAQSSQQPAYAQQSRPRSVKKTQHHPQGSSSARGLPSPAMEAGHPSQRAANAYQQQTQQSTSPTQPSYGQTVQAPVNTTRSAAMTAATQYDEYNRRQLPNPTSSVSESYTYGDTQAIASAAQPTANSEAYNQSAITVDPMAVYDPWPQYQRNQEALRAQKAIEDAARAEDERLAGKGLEEEQRKVGERNRQEGQNRARQEQMDQGKQKGRKSHSSNSADADTANSAQDAPMSGEMEEQIRALMAKMREFNSKDPALLARIWEEERRAKAPTIQGNPALQATPAIAQTNVAAANQSRKATIKEAPVPKTAISTAVPVEAPAPAAPLRHPGGNTIWPPEKKSQLATAASAYLNAQNPARPLESGELLRMLDGNPSYIELCEQLELMGLKLDRAAFAKNLLNAVPDVNSASRARTSQGLTTGAVNGTTSQRASVAPPAVMKRGLGAPATPASGYASPPTPPYPAFSKDNAPKPGPVAEKVPIKPELKVPANKEEAARKRTFDDLIDLTQMPDDEDFEPPPKKMNTGPMYSIASPGPVVHDTMDMDGSSSANFRFPARGAPHAVQELRPPQANELRYTTIVEPLDRKKALRRNNYNIKTIARDVLLACGRHPDTRQLNQHLELLKTTLPQITNDADLSTLRWDLIDPGEPPPGYFKDSVEALAEDADDEEDSEEESRELTRRSSTQGGYCEGTGHNKTQALLEATNPFKQKRRGRPPRHSLPADLTASTINRPKPTPMSASAPRPTATAANIGYAAFRSATEYDTDGKPLPKKKGRPVGWRKHIHGSAAAQAHTPANKPTAPLRFVPAQPSTLRHVKTGPNESIRIDSRSPSVPDKAQRYQSYKCEWHNCKAELHNLETLKKHVHKVHRKENVDAVLECHWADCAIRVASHDAMTNMRIERHEPRSFHSAMEWQEHLEQTHFSPLSWQLGDGPASGLSGEWNESCTFTYADVDRLSRSE
jgi:hypothetical protein